MKIEVKIEVTADTQNGTPTRHAWVIDQYQTGDSPGYMGADTRQAMRATMNDLSFILELFASPDREPSTWLKRERRTCGSEVTT